MVSCLVDNRCLWPRVSAVAYAHTSREMSRSYFRSLYVLRQWQQILLAWILTRLGYEECRLLRNYAVWLL
jgi:hypothetical protein